MRILVSGAGIAGLAAGINLGATGHDVTIVERAGHLRVNGSPVDVRGDALDVARSMGVLDHIHARRVTMTERSEFIDAAGETVAAVPLGEIGDSVHDIEIPREDLAHVLHGALTDRTSLVFGESIAELQDDGDGVETTFASGRRDRFDLIVGADGLHSVTRRLTFGPERDYLHHLGFYVALTDLPAHHDGDRTSRFLNWPGHLIGIGHYNDTTIGVLNFRSDWIDYDYRDLDAQRRILLDAFAGHDEWRVPEILDAVANDPELYFDSVSQIHLPTWHRGRVVLVGDAAHCASNLSGRGASLALTGTWLLAQALIHHPDDLEAAFAEYEAGQRPYVTRAQDSAGPGGDFIMPATQAALDARNERLRAM
ncbi:FAD-dependent monooxygenase [Catenuloplanes sp. NPDC051500]|uniref:FAD-dependent monooxygenase n=1 Tax=Catenuloplanes sp. NPDC051500 TaxID=3363959 RepID=UPI0037AB10BE